MEKDGQLSLKQQRQRNLQQKSSLLIQQASQMMNLRKKHDKIIAAINRYIWDQHIPDILESAFGRLPDINQTIYKNPILLMRLKEYKTDDLQGPILYYNVFDMTRSTKSFTFSFLVFLLCSSEKDVPKIFPRVCQFVALYIYNGAINEGGMRQLRRWTILPKLIPEKIYSLNSMSNHYFWQMADVLTEILLKHLSKSWLRMTREYPKWRLFIDDDCYCETESESMHAFNSGQFKLNDIHYELMIDQRLEKPGIYIETDNPEYNRIISHFKKGQCVKYYDEVFQCQSQCQIVDPTQDKQRCVSVLLQDGSIQKKDFRQLYTGDKKQLVQKKKVLYYPLPPQKGVNCGLLSRMNLFRGIYMIKTILDQERVEITDAVEKTMRAVDSKILSILRKLRAIANDDFQRLQSIQQQY